MQGTGKWFEGAQSQSVYWAVSNDTGLTWGPTEVMIPSPDTLPLWGPVVHSTVRSATLRIRLIFASAAAQIMFRFLDKTLCCVQCYSMPDPPVMGR